MTADHPNVKHNPGCRGAAVRAKMGRLGDTIYRCESCRGLYVERNGTTVPPPPPALPRTPAPVATAPQGVRHTVATAERYGVPAAFLDHTGRIHLVRTVAEFDDITRTTEAATAARTK